MEAVTAFSLAGTILQFIDSGARFAALAWRLYQHGSDEINDHVHLRKLTDELDALLPNLTSTGEPPSGEENLCQLALDCGKTNARSLSILKKVDASGNTRKRDAIRAAFQLVYKRGEIESLQDQLACFRTQSNLHLLVSLR